MRQPEEVFDLQSLFSGRAGLTPSEGGHLAEAAAVCIAQNGRIFPVPFTVVGRHHRRERLTGPEVTMQMRRTHGDLQDAAEYGAAATGVLCVEACEGLTVYERSRKDGHGFDYYLIQADCVPDVPDENFLAAATATLEVSGILSGVGRVEQRMREKLERLARRPKDLPCYVVGTEFGTPMAQVERYERGT